MSKWLLRKTSGSRARYKSKGDYSNDRPSDNSLEFEHLPQRQSMRNKNPHNTYLDTSLVKRWLNSKIGQDFDAIYSEFLTRIQPKYLEEYKDCIYWYVEKAENVTIKDTNEIWGKWYGKPVKLPHTVQMTYYVHPKSNKLLKIVA